MDAEMTMHRPASGAPLAGVCAAIAERTGIDPLIIRVAAVLFAVSSGIGVVLYLAGWVLIPREGHERGPLLEAFPSLVGAPRWAIGVVLAIALLAVGITISTLTPASLFPALVVGLVYYFGVHRPRSRGIAGRRSGRPVASPRASEPVPPARPFGASTTGATEAEQPTVVRPPERVAPDPVRQAYLSHPDPIGLYAPPPSTPRAARLPDPQRLGRRTLGLVTLTTVGLLWTGLSLAMATGATVPPYAWAASALLVVGVALVIGAWVGRPRGMVPAAVVLAVVATVTSHTMDRPIPQPVLAPESVTYALTEALPSADSWDVGAPTVDLRDLRPTEDVTYEVHIDAGSLTILVPESSRVVVNARISMGTMTLGDWTTDRAPAQDVTRVVSPGEPGAATITINASAEFGELVVKPS